MYNYYVQNRHFCQLVAGHPLICRDEVPVLFFGDKVVFSLTFPADTFSADDIVTLAVDVDKDFLNTSPLAIATVTLDAPATTLEFPVPCRTQRFRDIINGRNSELMAYLQVTRWRHEGDDIYGHVLCDEKCVLKSLVSDYGAEVEILPKPIIIPVPVAADNGKVIGVNAIGEYVLVTGGGGGGQENVIEAITVNDNTVPIENKVAKITISIPSSLSDLTDDAGHRTVTDAEKNTWDGKQDALSASNKLPYEYISNPPDIPTVNNATITIKQGGTVKGLFTVNQDTNVTIDLDAGGGSTQAQVIESTEATLQVEAGGVYKWTPAGDGALSITGTQAGYEAFVNIAIVLGAANVVTVSGMTLVDSLTANKTNFCCIYYDGAAARLYVVDVRTTA